MKRRKPMVMAPEGSATTVSAPATSNSHPQTWTGLVIDALRLGTEAPVARRGGQQDRRVAARRLDLVIGRYFAQERPVFRLVRIAVFADPARPGGELGVALHVEQRHRAVDGAEQVRIAREHVADQKSAVAAAFAREPLWLRDAARDQVLGHSGKIVMRELFARSHAGLVPIRSEL